MPYKIGFFDEAEGQRSSTRLFAQQTLIVAFTVICWQVYTNKVDLALIIILLTAALAPKAFQKIAELKAGAGNPK